MTEETSKKKKKTRAIKWDDLTAIEYLKKMGKQQPDVISKWASDPDRQRTLKQVIRAALDFQKLRIGMDNREVSPVEDVNDAQLLPGDVRILGALGRGLQDMEDSIKASVRYLVGQAEIGQWLLDQKGLKAGWLAGVVLAEFPDIYDAAICLKCGTHLQRQVDGTYEHPVLPGSKDLKMSTQVPCESNRCPLQGVTVEACDYRMHQRKPSTFARFAGLSTEKSYACPACQQNLVYNSAGGEWRHPQYTKLPNGKCEYSGKALKSDGKVPYLVIDGRPVEAVERWVSPKVRQGQKLSYNSFLRSKLLGKNGVADMFIMQKHPKYYDIYAGYKHRVAQRDPWRAKGHIDMMAKRAMLYRFICDFQIKWRELEGLEVRRPYEEEKLGIVHHP